MTLKEAIDFADGIKPNAFTNDQKTQWLNEIDGRVQTEVFLWGITNLTTYTYEANKNAELFVKPPYDQIYYEYLCAKIDWANGEYDKYQNTAAVFESDYTAFKRWFIDTYRPADCKGGCVCGV